jgi:hypothetical protein
MLKGHAQYENRALHELLRKKNSPVYAHVEEDHKHYDEVLENLHLSLEKVIAEQKEDERVEMGYQFYLQYRKFVGENLLHLHEEETEILPELQRLYTDEELKMVEADTYRQMSPAEMIEMIGVLFPHMNPDDKRAFLLDIKESQPNKFTEVWAGIQLHLSTEEGEKR